MEVPEQLSQFFQDMPGRVADLVQEGWQACSIAAIRGQRQRGRGLVFLIYDTAADRIVVLYIDRKALTDPQVKEMFPDALMPKLRKATKLYDPRDSFCLVVADQIDDVFYTLSPMNFAPGFTPKMGDKELDAAEAAFPKQDTGIDFGLN